MKKLFIGLGFLMAFTAYSCGNPEHVVNGAQSTVVEQTKPVMQNVQASDLKKAIEQNQSIIILDVRTASEVADGYITGAENLDVNESDFDKKTEGLDKSKTVYVYCRSGHRSQIASKKLLSLGFTDVRNVEGGFMAWSEAGYEFSK